LQSLNRSSVPFKNLIDSRMLRGSSTTNDAEEKYEERDEDPSLAWTRDGKVYNKGKGGYSLNIISFKISLKIRKLKYKCTAPGALVSLIML